MQHSREHPAAPGAAEIRAALSCYRGGWRSVAVFSAAINLLMLVPSLFMLQVYDRVLASGNLYTLAMLCLMAAGLLAVMGALEYARGLLLIQLGARFDALLGPRVHGAAFARGLSGAPANAAQAVGDLNALRQFLTGSAVFAFFDAPWFPLFLAVMFLFHPWLGALALAGAGLLMALAWANERACRQPLAEAGALSVRASLLAESQLRNAESIQAMGMLDALRARWQGLHGAYVGLQGQASRRSALVSSVSRSVRIALQSGVLAVGAWLALDNRVSAGMMVAGSILMGRVLSPIDQVIAAWRQWAATRLAQQRLQALLAAHPAPAAGLPLPAPQGALALETVTVVPPGAAQPSLVNLSLALAPGQVLGVVGPSGSGKSTLARAVAGIWPARVGTVRLDGADLRHWDRQRLGAWMGYLPQDVELFAGTVAENIARFAVPQDPAQRQAQDAQVIEAARLAGAHELILALPHGYDTVLGAGGLGLSGGQRQRVALARALYGDPRLVVLDEPNASLDEAGEQALLDALLRLRERRVTVVLVAHRPKVLAAATHLLVLRAGQKQAFGPAQEVMAHAGGAAAPTGRAAATPAAASPASLGAQAWRGVLDLRRDRQVQA
ncbi:type I secretion system permease/ATPase [Orrella sp. JC864]|uniref:type I secretion system permease/ATPase n=1 Tax=Orrella sp. JC864 TaxID=3120298 RepID=UPI003008262C